MVERKKLTSAAQALAYIAVLKTLSADAPLKPQEILDGIKKRGYDVELLTLQRMLKVMRETPDFEVKVNTKSKPYGYSLKKERAVLSRVKLNAVEIMTQALAGAHLENELPGLPGAKTPISLEGKVAVVPNSFPMIPARIEEGVFEAVCEGLVSEKKLELTYRDYVTGEVESCVVSPLGLVEQERRLFLVLAMDEVEAVTHVALSQVSKATVLEDAAEIPEDFTLAGYMAGRHCNYYGADVNQVTLEFDIDCVEAFDYLTETPLSTDQSIEEFAPNMWHVRATVADSELLDHWIIVQTEIASIFNVQKHSRS